MAELLGIEITWTKQGFTVEELARAKGLPESTLESWGAKDGISGSGANRRPCVDIPYVSLEGEVVAVHKRLSMNGSPRFVWRRGDKTTLYGLARLNEIRRAGRVILVEGETDVWTLWHVGFPALGLAGASTWREEYAPLLQGLEVYIWHEPDAGGDALVQAVANDLPELRVIEAPPSVKDASELFQLDPDGFVSAMETLLQSARPISEIRQEAFSAEARQCHAACLGLLQTPDILDRLKELISQLGYAGDPRPAILTFVAIISRLLERPINLAYISLSSAGKNAAIEVNLPIFSEEAYYLVRTSSPRALIYNAEEFRHRIVILTEADSLPEDGPAASAIRSLMSDGEMSYEVVEKGNDGQFHVRKIVKPGPTGLITTSIRPLGDQASTRTLTVSIADTPEQTRLVLHAQARRFNQTLDLPDLTSWTSLDRWLELAGERRVVIPFAHPLADLVPASAVRIRRDFPQLLTVIQVFALLHQSLRNLDPEGRIIATIEDYAEARWLLEESFTISATEGLTPAVRQTVEAVSRLSQGLNPVSEQQLVFELGLSRSTVSYRVRRALRGGWLINRTTQKGLPAQLVLGAPMPEGCPLPTADELLVCVDDHPIRSNDSNSAPGVGTDRVQNDRRNTDSEAVHTGTNEPEPGPNESPNYTPGTDQPGPFEVFEPDQWESTHTQKPGPDAETQMPWDAFLNQAENDGPNAG